MQQQALTLRSQKAPKLAALQQASSGAEQAPEFAAATQQALTLWSRKAPKLTALQQAPEPDKLRSLLRCNNKLSRSRACCCNAASSHALELVALQQASSGVCCVATASSHALELGALQGLVVASKLRSRKAPEKLRSLELACLVKQNKQK